MTPPFWKPRPGKAAEWWARCDYCHWSGPADRFDLWQRGQDVVTICQHTWCTRQTGIYSHLINEGWSKWNSPQ